MTDEQPQKRGRGRPATGKTPVRSVRIGQVWDDLEKGAGERGENMTALVTRLLEQERDRLRAAGEL